MKEPQLVPIRFLFIVMLFLMTKPSQSQNKESLLSGSILPHRSIGVQIQANIAPKGSIATIAGNYPLQSKLQSSFDGGFVCQFNLDSYWNMSYGLQLNIVSTNYYLHIPDSDLPGYPSSGGAPQIEDKQAYFKLAIPVLLSYNFLFDRHSFYSLRTGGKLNYSGFSIDERVSTSIADSNRQLTKIFQGDFTSGNNKKPWISYILGISKTIKLKNGGLLSIDLLGEVGTTKFIKGNYQITVPNKPVTDGVFSVKGSGAGISFQYLFPKSRKNFL